MIIVNNEDYFRKAICSPVTSDEVGEIISNLELELNKSNFSGKPGIGLAAPQIGINKQVAIVRIGEIKINLINCKIKQGYDSVIFRSEGCLSFPGRVEDTNRYQEIYLTDNLHEVHSSMVIRGLPAVVCQHEIDHWNQKLFWDYKVNNKIGANDPCYCGSGKKYKRCCK